LDRVEAGRTAIELELVRRCLSLEVPLLGVCGGMQVMAVAAGGTLIQDLPNGAHEQPTDPASPYHLVNVEPPVAHWLGPSVEVNSTHHQAVGELATPFVSAGSSPDGVIEVLVAPSHPFAVGVQWHPELLGDYRLYRALVGASARRRHSRSPQGHEGE
ncbi:MAG: C26 family cysteine hydrolase domain-containing family, partial [Proteobacteria bacterium]|nr:C26 family cysteine hydrolase domain-containing family [Pseudomonadota bacterium]